MKETGIAEKIFKVKGHRSRSRSDQLMGRDIRHTLRRFGVELACISGDSCSILAQHTANLLHIGSC